MQNPTSSTTTTKNTLGSVIKLGIDAHASTYVVVMKIDSSSPLRAKRMKPDAFLLWVKELTRQCDSLHSCYEAGPFGYSLHRKLTAMGIDNHVIRPINWDTHGKNVKTDARDATQMALSLDGYLRGNDRSFSVIRVPSEQEERRRSLTRQRQTFIKERARAAKRGMSHGLYYDQPLPSGWWKPLKWNQLQDQLEDFLLTLLEPLRANCLHFDQLITQTQKHIETLEPERVLPKGMGFVLYEQIEREVCNWDRFKNRKSVSSFTGLCPSEDTSSNRRFQGSINKHGNRRLRHMLVECAWLLIRWNPTYSAVVKWQKKLSDTKTTKASRKKIAVAIARQFAVDWWRVQTGQCTLETFGLVLRKAR